MHSHRLALRIVFLSFVLLLAPRPGGAAELTVQGSRFAVDGVPEFLLGVSAYGALGAAEGALPSDLEKLRQRGVRWIRVWATWSAFGEDVSAVDSEGRAREPFLGRLKRLVDDCDRLGLVVDVSLCRGKGDKGPSRVATLDAQRRAVETIIGALKERRNWYLDLSNERNIQDDRFTSFADLRELRDLVRRLDPRRLVTASQGGDIGQEELRKYLETAQVHFIAPHRPRDAESPARTEAETRQLVAWMREIGRVVPVHYQEPFRRGYAGWEPGVEDFLADIKGAMAGGAAGWCLHNGSTRPAPDGRPRRSFDLREKGLLESLDPVELEVLAKMSGVTAGAPAK